MTESPDEIVALLRMAEAAGPVAREFAWVWLDAYRREAAEVLRWGRRHGRLRALAGEDPAGVRRRVEECLQAARARLKGRLARVVAWAMRSRPPG